MPSDLALDQPWALALLPLPLLVWLLMPSYRAQIVALRAPFLARLAPSGRRHPEAPRPSLAVAALAVLAWALFVLALAAPVRIEPPLTRDQGGRDILLALDLSGSMDTRDMGLPGGPPGAQQTRVEAARAVLRTFIAGRRDDRIGLLVFGTGAFMLAPFTADHATLLALLDQAASGMAGPQTMIGDAIGLAAQVFEHAKTQGRLLVLLTDGNDTGSRVPPPRAADIARTLGIKLYAVSLGDPHAVGEAALDVATLEAITQATGGRHFHADDPQALAAIYRQIDAMEPSPRQVVSWRPRTALFTWPLGGFAILVVLLALVAGWRGRTLAA